MSMIWIIVLIIGVAMATYGWWKIAASFVTDGPAESRRVRRNGIISFLAGAVAIFLAMVLRAIL